jgi:hypothetical protein
VPPSSVNWLVAAKVNGRNVSSIATELTREPASYE